MPCYPLQKKINLAVSSGLSKTCWAIAGDVVWRSS